MRCVQESRSAEHAICQRALPRPVAEAQAVTLPINDCLEQYVRPAEELRDEAKPVASAAERDQFRADSWVMERVMVRFRRVDKSPLPPPGKLGRICRHWKRRSQGEHPKCVPHGWEDLPCSGWREPGAEIHIAQAGLVLNVIGAKEVAMFDAAAPSCEPR